MQEEEEEHQEAEVEEEVKHRGHHSVFLCVIVWLFLSINTAKIENVA